MLCRVLLAVIGLSYLVCVLFLSGIQREDLDVSLLKKMRHYDINYDKNNEQLRTECLNDTGKKKSKYDSDQNTEVAMSINNSNTGNKAVSLDTSELKSVLKYLKHKKKIRDPPTTETNKWKNYEGAAEMKLLIENLMSNNENNEQKNLDSVTQDNFKQSPSEVNKYLPLPTRKQASETQPANITQNKTVDKIVQKTENNYTKEVINKGVDMSNLKDQIGQFIAEYLSKKIALPITMKPEPEKRTTETPQINVKDIEQKFASSLAAINKLNENIAILQKNMNGAKESTPNDPIKANKSETNFVQKNEKYTKEVNKNVTNNIPMTKTVNSHMNYDIPKTIDVIRTTVEPLTNSPLEVASQVNNSLDSHYTRYDKERYVESEMLKNAKQNLLNNPNTKDMILSQYDYDRQKIANLLLNAKADISYTSKNNQFDSNQKDIKEVTDYNYEKQKNPDNTNSVKAQIKYPDDQLPFMTDSQNIQDMVNYGYYNQRQSENRMQHFQYDSMGNNYLQGGRPDPLPTYNTDKFIEDANAPVHQNNVDIYKNNQIQYSPATQNTHNTFHSNYDKQGEPDTNVMDVQNNFDVLKNRQLPLPYQMQNGKDLINAVFEMPNGFGSHILPKPQESFKQFPLPFQIQSERDTLNPTFDGQHELDTHIPKQQENSNRFPLQMENGKDSQSFGCDTQNIETNTIKPQENCNKDKADVSQANNTQKDNINSFSMDMISKIAESVKEIVLKDLKKEMTSSTLQTTSIPSSTMAAKTTTISTTSSPTTTISTTTEATTTPTTTTTSVTTTTTASTTTTSKPTTKVTTKPTCTTTVLSNTELMDSNLTVPTNTTQQKINDSKIQDATQVIQKFIQLFEQMKSSQVQDLSKTKEKRLQPKVGKSRYNLPIVMFPPPLPPMNPFGISGSQKQMPIIVHNYIPPTLNRPPFLPNYNPRLDTSNSMSRVHQPPNFEPQRFPNAVMIQTNKHVIQPLGVPMVKPEAINLNIIMTTQNPLWSRQERDRWNYMFKYSRSPDKQKDIKNVKNSFNIYSNNHVQGSKYPNNKILNKENVLALNKSGAIDDNTKLAILKQLNLYNKPENTNKNAIEEVRNQILSQVNQQNQLDAIKNQLAIGNKLNPKNYIDYSNTKALLDQMATHNENLFNMPYNSKVGIDPVDNIYKDINMNPNNLLYGQLQNRGLINEMNPYVYKQPQLNYFDQSQVMNTGSLRPTSFQSGNTQFISKDNNMPDVNNQVYRTNAGPAAFNLIPNDIAHEQFKSHYLNPTSEAQIHNVNVMPMKDISNYSNQPKLYQTDRVNNFKIIPNNGVKHTRNPRPTLENRSKYSSLEYQYDNSLTRLKDGLPNGVRTPLKNNMEKYYENTKSESTKTKDNRFLTNERNYVRPTFSHDLSPTMEKIKMKFENPRYYSSPSDEESNREIPINNRIRPYGVNTRTSIMNAIKIDKQRGREYSGFENKKHVQPQMDLIKAVFGKLDKYKTSKERYQSLDSDRDYRGNSKYHPRDETMNSKLNMKARRPHEDSDSDSKLSGNVRGFHDKLESSDSWPESPTDCGSDERCMSSLKILSRHQQPLGSKNKYDDSRFKSFLKTQQKVNQMLEMILASKTDPDEAHSVEHV